MIVSQLPLKSIKDPLEIPVSKGIKVHCSFEEKKKKKKINQRRKKNSDSHRNYENIKFESFFLSRTWFTGKDFKRIFTRKQILPQKFLVHLRGFQEIRNQIFSLCSAYDLILFSSEDSSLMTFFIFFPGICTYSSEYL